MMTLSTSRNKIFIHPIPAFKDNYIWAVINTITQEAVIVDPGEAEGVLHYCQQQQLTIKAILITHHHGDHTGGVEALIKQYSVPVFGYAGSSFPLITHHVKEGDRIVLDEHFPAYQVLEVPGHTLDHVAYYADNHLFCGDTLFAAGCGRLFEGSAEQMFSSLQKIADLPEETYIYCAHEYTLNNLRFAQLVEPKNKHILTRINQVTDLHEKEKPSLPSQLKEEKQTNPFLRCHIPALIQQVEQHQQSSLHQPVEVFAALRRWKDQF